jgi:hypothetical protein
MTNFGYTLMCEQAGPVQLVDDAVRAEGLRLRRHLKPLLSVAGRAGPRSVRLERARRGRAGDLGARVDDHGDQPDPALSPGRRGAEGGDRRAAVRRPVHAVQIGGAAQEPFLEFAQRELLPALRG